MFVLNVSDLQEPPTRIVSLVPSITETLYTLGLENETVGITKFCVHPADWYRTKTRIGGTKNVDFMKIASLHPDLIIANKEENVEEQIHLLARDYPVWLTDIGNLTSAIEMITDIGMLCNRKSAAANVRTKIESAFEACDRQEKKFLRAVYLIWQEPYMITGGDSFISAMMRAAGFLNCFEGDTRYPSVTLSEIIDRRPDVVLLSSEPFPFRQKHLIKMQQQITASKIMLVDGEMFSWYGSRMLLAPAYFAMLRDQLNQCEN